MMVIQSLDATDMKFLLSNPPHPNADPVAMAGLFGTTAAEARIKLNFPGAEVWFVEDEGGDLSERVQAVRDGGANATVTSGHAIAGLSNRNGLRGFAFRDDGLHLEVNHDETLTIPYDWQVHAVTCRPMEQESIVRMTMRQAAKAAKPHKTQRQQARTSISQMKAPTDPSFLDVYFSSGSEVHRVTALPGKTEFSGLGDRKKLSTWDSMAELVAMLDERFAAAIDDRRLVNAPAPRITLLGKRTLRGHLELVEPSMKDIDEYDLMSRLAFLAHRPLV